MGCNRHCGSGTGLLAVALLCGTVGSAFAAPPSTGKAKAATGKAATQASKGPSWDDVAKTAEGYFAGLPGHQKGDLVTRSQVQRLLAALEKQGWKVSDAGKIAALTPADAEPLAQSLSGESGVKFMRQVSGYPKAYDRLERLLAIPQGKQIVRDLVKGKDGSELIEYLTTTKGGRNLGKMLSQVPNGADFNQPTGHLYTADQVIDRLQESYQLDHK